MPDGTATTIICTEGRPATIEVNGLNVQNSDHELVRPVDECNMCLSQSRCDEYHRTVRERG
ncbi:MAG: hypothetical protein V1917_00535 [Candidatus Gottesmanbacteria bacterium]